MTIQSLNRLLLALLAVGLGLLGYQLSTATAVHAFNVNASVKRDMVQSGQVVAKRSDPPPAMVKIVNKKDNKKGNLLYINTDIDYGNVFPGESPTGHFIVYLAEGVDKKGWQQGPYSRVQYSVTVKNAAGKKVMKSYLLVRRDPAETDTNDPDPVADGRLLDFGAIGVVDTNDISDKWLVTFYVPEIAEGSVFDYGAQIEIEVWD